MSFYGTIMATTRRSAFTTTALSRTSNVTSRAIPPARPFSITSQLRATTDDVPKGNGNPGSGLGYSPRQIWRRASPRARFWIVVGLGVAMAGESTFWVTFGPKVFGWEGKEEGTKGRNGRM